MLRERFDIWLPLAVFFLIRAVNAVMISLASRRQIAIPSTGLGGRLAIASPSSPDYWVVASNWDGRWYGAIATYGYPDHLPMDAGGQVLQNAYAFPPMYPMLARLVMMVTGLDFTMAAPIVSLACGAGAMLLVYRLVADAAGRRAGALTVVAGSADIRATLADRAERGLPTVLTPHDGEFERLQPGLLAAHGRLDAARAAASALHSIIVLKGPGTVIVDPEGTAFVDTEGPADLGTAGSGDVLTGVVAAVLAGAWSDGCRDAATFTEATAAAVWLHGRAGREAGITAPVTATDIAAAVPAAIRAARSGDDS